MTEMIEIGTSEDMMEYNGCDGGKTSIRKKNNSFGVAGKQLYQKRLMSEYITRVE